ncbi:putative multicopper oxidase family protein [Lyophyllum shimeji]|uniref:Multicopper oxidase family protein n=1 Tax=Lyophyllum shimeji TaxID=47721 RepID=A0A9P3PKQ4_LYOSH|nr:putative multicopper oxidase family protein [Lyophyllum shimeji]
MFWAATLVGLSTPFLVAAASLGITPPSQPNLPPKQLRVANGVIAPDGFNRSAVLVNGQHPAPLITGKKGSKFRLNVENALTDPTMQRGTSIHWHGFLQRGTNYADGPVGVSQCPIAPQDSFLYEFTVNDQAGTFWYHSHFSTQYCDGLRGPFVVYDDNDPHRGLYDVDDENTVLTVGEWYHTPSPSILTEPLAHSTLINGKGRSTNGPAVPLAVVNVEKGKRYRMRLVSIACDSNYMFSIDGHSFLVIEVDGENIIPYKADKIQIFAGQRYSFVLFANQKVDNYRIRALPNNGRGDLPLNFDGGINSAILRYKGARAVEPTTKEKKNPKLLDESQLRPLLLDARAPGVPRLGAADVNINLDVAVDLSTLSFTINGASYQTPSVPILLQLLSGAKTAQQLLPAGSIIPLPRNKVIEVTMPGGAAAGPHPFHLHGHSFSVVRSAGKNARANYLNPVRRDVVNIGDAGSNVTIRFVTDNPGPWFLHCHIDWHLDRGLAVVFAEDPATTDVTVQPPDDWRSLCPAYDALAPSATAISQVPEVTSL